MSPQPETVEPYTALAVGYDAVMQYIDYGFWAEHVQGLLERHHPEANAILELGCGTGTFAFQLQPRGDYQYVGTDRSPAMIRVARIKAKRRDLPVRFTVSDFTDYQVSDPMDAVLLLYDGLNYTLDEDAVRALLHCTFQALRPGGVFIVDQSTPSNSANNEKGFEDEGEVDDFHYVRRSRYDAESQLHTTTFEIEVEGRTYREEHVQRAYALSAIRRLIRESDFEAVAAYDDFTTEPATSDSERVHHVLQRPM